MRAEIVGREAELSSLTAFVESERWPRALVLTGEPGIGKTTLWDAAVAVGRERQLCVIAARASEGSQGWRAYRPARSAASLDPIAVLRQ